MPRNGPDLPYLAPGDAMTLRVCPICSKPSPRGRACPEVCRSRHREAQRAARAGRTCAVCGGPSVKLVCGKRCQGKRAYQQRLDRKQAAIARDGLARRDAESRRIEATLALLDKRRKGQRWAA